MIISGGENVYSVEVEHCHSNACLQRGSSSANTDYQKWRERPWQIQEVHRCHQLYQARDISTLTGPNHNLATNHLSLIVIMSIFRWVAAKRIRRHPKIEPTN